MALHLRRESKFDPLKSTLLKELNQLVWEDKSAPLSLPSFFERVATYYQNKPALMEKVAGQYQSQSYEELGQNFSAVANALIEYGFKAGSRAALLMNNCSAWVYADYGSMAAGGTSVPIYPTLKSENIQYILEDSAAEFIFVEDAAQLEKITAIWPQTPKLKYAIYTKPEGIKSSDTIISLDEFMEQGKATAHHDTIKQRTQSLKRDDIASIVYTSGTTGVPKGVMLSHMNFLCSIASILSITDFNSHDRFISILPLSHVFERCFGYYTAINCGATIAYAEGIEHLSQNFSELAPTTAAVVPRIFEKIYTRMTTDISKSSTAKQKIFNWALNVGEKTQSVWLKQVQALGRKNPHLLPGEEYQKAHGISWWRHPLLLSQHKLANKLVYSKVLQKFGGRMRFFVTGGAPLSKEVIEFFRKLQIFVFEGYGLTETSPIVSYNYGRSYKPGTIGKTPPHVQVSFSEEGEILVKAPNVMKGYLNKPEETAQAIDADGWFHTGDVGELDEENFLRITDRIKELIVLSTGKNVAPLPIEQKLNQCPLISHTAVLGNNCKYISAIIFPDVAALTEHAKQAGITELSLEALSQDPQVRQWIGNAVETSNQSFPSYEQIKRFEIAPHDLMSDTALLTPTLKLKRKAVSEKFPSLIEKLYPQKQ